MKIVLHGFGTYAVLFRHLIETAQKRGENIQWSIILPTPHHLDLFRSVIPGDRILSLQDRQSTNPSPLGEMDRLRNYPGNIFADIETEKRFLKHRPAWWQVARAAEIYDIYKSFLEHVRPTHMLVSQIEAYEAKMLVGLARNMGIEVITPVIARMFEGTLFSLDALETLPPPRKVTPELREQARLWLKQYRSRQAVAQPARRDDEMLNSFRDPLHKRLRAFVKRSISRPDLFEIDNVRAGLLNNLPPIRNAWWRAWTALAARHFDIDSLDGLPSKFVYYPLQMTPESSINTPAPYFVDQLRAIDAIRFAMPSDHVLIVKEHPSAIMVRPTGFVPALRRRAGIAVAHYRLDSVELTKRAACTVSVTGTATIEAFLHGRSSVALGPNMFTRYLGGVCPLAELPDRLQHAGSQPPAEENIVTAVAEILGLLYDFRYGPPGLPGEPVLRQSNVDKFLTSLLDHIQRTGNA